MKNPRVIKDQIRNSIINFKICCFLVFLEKKAGVDARFHSSQQVMRNNGQRIFHFSLLHTRMSSRLNFGPRQSFPFITFHRNLAMAPQPVLLTNASEFYYPYVIMCCEPRIDERRLQASRSLHDFNNLFSSFLFIQL